MIHDLNQTIAHFLTSPPTKSEILEIKNKFPWFSGIYTLETILYHNSSAYQFKQSLHTAALYTTDRGVLFDLLNQSKLNDTIKIDTLSHEVPPKEDDQAITTIDNTLVSLPSDVPKEEKVSLKKERIIHPPTEKIDFSKIVVYDPKVELETQVQEKIQKKNVPTAFETLAYNPEKELSKLDNTPKKEVESAEMDFFYWLNNDENQSDNPDLMIDSENEGLASNVSVVQDLLQQFLDSKKNKPLIKKEFYNPENKAKESQTENFTMVTETLAKLYIKQGHLDQAQKVYKKLLLENPSKETYFAAQIKNIEHLKKTDLKK